MILISYTNARGEEIILDDTERSFMGELYGREGTEAPTLKYTEILYGDGSSDIVVVNPMPRTVTLYFYAVTKDWLSRHELEEIKQKLIQTGSRSGSWGQLKIWQPDQNAYKYLNCVYTGGFDSFVRDYPYVTKFALTFRANDPYFYNGYQTVYVVEPDASKGYLMMKDLSFAGAYDFSDDNSTDNPNGLYMLPLTDTAHDDLEHNETSVYMVSAASESTDDIILTSQKIYPKITIAGSATNIRLINTLTGRKIEFTADVIVDGMHSIVIETKPLHRKVVQVNLVTGEEVSLISKMTADSNLDFYLDRGTNVIKFRNSEATPESSCTFEYTEGFLSAE